MDETPDERRARLRRWAREETDPYYRREFLLAALTPRQRFDRWWYWNWPIVVPLVGAGLAALALGIIIY
jgi:hypothetical protein